jgi:hypothetical protein
VILDLTTGDTTVEGIDTHVDRTTHVVTSSHMEEQILTPILCP